MTDIQRVGWLIFSEKDDIQLSRLSDIQRAGWLMSSDG